MAVILHHELTMPVGRLHASRKCKLHLPLRKVVACRTLDLQQSLLARLGRATQSAQAPFEGAQSGQYGSQEGAFKVVSHPP